MSSDGRDPDSPLPGARTAHAARLWRPVLGRAAVAVVFAAVTIFWQQPSTTVMAVAGGLYLLGTAAGVLWLRVVLPTGRIRLVQLIEALVLAAAAVVVLAARTAPVFAAAASLALLAAGALEVYLGVVNRKTLAVARDWIITGIVSIGTGILLPFFTDLGAHGLLGVFGGSAILTGVVLLLAGLGYRYDADTGRGPTAEAVN